MADPDPQAVFQRDPESAPDPRTVFLADNPKLAEAVVQLLAGAGFAAETVSAPPSAATEPITGLTDMVTPGEVEVRVTDEKQAEAARELLGSAISKAALRATQEKRASRTGTVAAVCEDCGKSSDWPAAAMGTTETCPHCTGYMDIPDPDDDWSDVDFGDEDDGDDHEETEK